ncbi:putative esterase [hydrothermal vent metagenome]|uniref:Putative esterase n=1 Tax=hydrothermal vent metagenome TaxID=652676 RepID=A0A3B1D438_9ZZZZ
MHRLIRQMRSCCFLSSMIILIAIPLMLTGCGENQNSQTSGSINSDGGFSASIPRNMQKHRSSGKVVTAKLIVDANPPIEMVINHETDQMTARVDELSPRIHTFVIEYYLDGILSATARKEVEIVVGVNAAIDFGASSIVNEVPKVTSTTPSEDATAVEPNATVSAAFSLQLDPLLINADTFTLQSTVGPLAGNVTYTEVSGFSATFTPLTKFALATEYTATLSTGVSSLLGAPLAADHQWRFTIRDGVWKTAEKIETDDAGSVFGPQVALDPNGNAIVAWSQWDATKSNIWANRFVPNTGWGTAEKIETDDAGNALSPEVALDPNGNAIATWSQWDGTRDNIWANRFVPGTGWGTAEKIATDDTGSAFDPQVALDPNGNAIVAWSQWGDTLTNIWANRFAPGTGWEIAEKIEIDDAGGAFSPQVALDPNGNAIVTWRQWDGTRDNIWANRFVPGTGWGTAEKIATDDTGNALDPQMALDPNGNAIVTWRQWDGTRWNIWANRFVPGTGWGTAEKIETDDTGHAVSPQVALDPKGNAIVTWEQSDGTRTDVWANRFLPSTGWGTAEKIETDDAGDASDPQVALDPNGNAIVTWEQSDGTRTDVWANRFVPGIGWRTAEKIEIDDDSVFNFNPQVALDPNGNAIVTWQQWDGTDGTQWNTWANRFE